MQRPTYASPNVHSAPDRTERRTAKARMPACLSYSAGVYDTEYLGRQARWEKQVAGGRGNRGRGWVGEAGGGEEEGRG